MARARGRNRESGRGSSDAGRNVTPSKGVVPSFQPRSSAASTSAVYRGAGDLGGLGASGQADEQDEKAPGAEQDGHEADEDEEVQAEAIAVGDPVAADHEENGQHHAARGDGLAAEVARQRRE